MRDFFNSRATGSLGMLLIIIATIAVVSFATIQRLIANNHEAARTHLALEALEAMLRALTEVETGQRGFILTGEEIYLNPYYGGIEEITRRMDALTELTANDPALQEEILALRPLFGLRLALIQQAIVVRRNEGLEATLDLIGTHEGHRIMESIRASIDRIRVSKQQILQQQTLAVERAGQAALLVVVIGSILSAVLLAVASVMIYNDLQRRKQAEQQLADAYNREHRIAETLQRSLLLAPQEDAFNGLAVASIYEAAWKEAQLGGDFFDVFALPEHKVALVVGDASGKGLAAAVRTAEVKYALRAYLREVPDAARTLSRLNDFVCSAQTLENRSISFVVVSVAVLDIGTGETTFAAAGAEPPAVVRRDGTVEMVDADGMPLGVQAGEEYRTATLQLEIGDLILMATDGITEARRGPTEFFGYEGLTDAATEALGRDSMRQIGLYIMDRARNYAGGTLHDDACLLLARRIESGDSSGSALHSIEQNNFADDPQVDSDV